MPTSAFADANKDLNPYAYIPDEFVDALNQLPPEQALELYTHLSEYTQCIDNGGAIDSGTTTLNMMNILMDYSQHQLKNFVEHPGESQSMPIPSYEGSVVCTSQAEAWSLLHGGRLAEAQCDETGERIYTFSRPIGYGIGVDATIAAPTCPNL